MHKNSKMIEILAKAPTRCKSCIYVITQYKGLLIEQSLTNAVATASSAQ